MVQVVAVAAWWLQVLPRSCTYFLVRQVVANVTNGGLSCLAVARQFRCTGGCNSYTLWLQVLPGCTYCLVIQVIAIAQMW